MSAIFVGMEDGLAVLRSGGLAGKENGNGAAGGDRWRLETRLDGMVTQCLAYDPLRPEHLYCGTFDDGLWRSDDGGDTWRPVGAGIPRPRVMAVAVSPLERSPGGGGVVYAGTEPSDLFRSEDGGDTWESLPALRRLPSEPTWSFPPRPDSHHVRWIEPDPAVAGRVFVSIEQGGVMRTEDGGATFQDRRPAGPRDAHTLATHPRALGRLYAAGAFEYAESAAAGEDWTRPQEGIDLRYLWSVAVAPGDPDAIVVSGAASPRAAHDIRAAASTLYVRQGAGPWRRPEGLPEIEGTNIYVLTSSWDEPASIYGAANRGVYRSPDRGRTWESIRVDWPERYLAQHVQGIAVTP
jgi:hypothetical protein